jgi:rhodanese-related sulfurtransferase
MKYIKLIIFIVFLTSYTNGQAQFVKDAKKTEFTIKNERAKIFYQILQNTKNPQILDIRTPAEYKNGHIKGAILVNFYDRNFATNLKKAGLNPLQPVFLYCRSGNRSSHAIPILKQLGFRHIVHLVYGLNEWKALQLPLEK